ncbi:hypothetical protein GCM10022280_09620 [Sphingomonas swuensis]|uniref:DUF306 domain-containing protein n=1 Tax=Sphingomonas swuensis TaxID=977800 RepID=A0ABP7SLR2_9SPHN
MTAAAGLLACQPGEQQAGAMTNKSSGAEAATPLGQWRIVEINGQPARSANPQAMPRLSIGSPKYGDQSGCTEFGGTALLHEERLYSSWLEADAKGCGKLDAQQSALFKLLTSAPTLRGTGTGRLTLSAGPSSMVLERIGPARKVLPDPAPKMQLAGTRWQLTGANGELITTAANSPAILQFEAEQWTWSASCGTWSGEWQQNGSALRLHGRGPPPSCNGNAFASALQEMIGGALAYVVGPNDQLVIAGKGNFIVGQFTRFTDQQEHSLLTGKWLVRAIDGRAPNVSPTPPNIIFSKASYGVWDGCNHTEGVYLTYGRQLLTRDSGLSTLANCLPERVSPQVPAIVGSSPQIARTKNGLALISSRGRLDLKRIPARSYPDAARSGLRPGMQIGLVTSAGPARLDLTQPRRFKVILPCGVLQGQWRSGQPARFNLDPVERHAPDCLRTQADLADRMHAMFQGEVQAAVDGNNEHVLLLNRHEVLAGRVAGR